MFGSYILDVAFGLVFVYMLLSLLCSTINEQVIARFFSLRSKDLEAGIKSMFGDDVKLTKEVYDHPFVKGLTGKTLSGKQRKPSYISSRMFAQAVMESNTVKAYKGDPEALKAYNGDPKTVKDSLPDGLLLVLERTKDNPQEELLAIERWYDDTMDRVSGWYKRKVQLIIFLLGLAIVVGLNVDTLAIITNLSNDAAIRAGLVSAVQGSAASLNHTDLSALQTAFTQIQPVIGWSALPANLSSWLLKIVGLLATTFAISLGAPFWFDLMNKFISFRSSGPPANTSTGTTVQAFASATPKSASAAVTAPEAPILPVAPEAQGQTSTNGDVPPVTPQTAG